MVPTQGRHVMANFWGCDPALLIDPDFVLALLKDGAIAAKATLVTCTMARTAVGVSGVVVVQESHLSIHTESAQGYAVSDFYTCGECIPEAACEVLAEGLKATGYQVMIINRGMSETPMESMQLVEPARIVLRGEDSRG